MKTFEHVRAGGQAGKRTVVGVAGAGSKAVMALAMGAAVLAGVAAMPTAAHAQVGVSIGINQPGVYGRIDLGNGPPPPVIYPQPVIIQQPPVLVERRPIYLRVPPGYEANWGRYCGRYAACGQPVYFVRDDPRPPPPPRGYYRPDDRHHDRHHDRRDWHDDHRGGPGGPGGYPPRGHDDGRPGPR